MDIFRCFPVTRTTQLVVMLIGHYQKIDGNITGSIQLSTLFSGKEREKIYSVVVVIQSKFSDRLWQSFSLALAKPNNLQNHKKSKNMQVTTFFVTAPD